MMKFLKICITIVAFMTIITEVNAGIQYTVQATDPNGQDTEIKVLDAYDTVQEITSRAYTKEQTNNLLDAKANATDVYTKTQTDTAISNAISSAGFVTENELNTKQNALSTEQLAATNSGITQTGVAQIGTNATNISNLQTSVSNIDTALSNKADASAVNALSQTVATNETAIDLNKKAISANLDKITTLDGKVATNETAIADNASNIATNATNISNLQASVSSNGANIQKIENQVWSLSEDYKQLKRDFNTGMASMAAMTALVPNARASGDTQLSIGTGAYNGHTAIAVGGFHWVNNDVLLNAGIAWGNSQDAVYKAGVTLSW